MAYIEGETLAARLDRVGRLAPRDAAELVCTVARAMQEAHRRGIVHRDLKPANLMIDPGGRPVVMDFGLAIRATAGDDLRLTLTGVALGTPAYMPPEQAGGDHDAIGPAADVYALGVILYELVTGRVPFKGKSFGKLLAQIERDPPPAPSGLNPDVDPALEAVILTCLAKRPADRFDTAGDLADVLARYLEGDRQGITARYSRPYVVPGSTAEFRSVEGATTAELRKPPRRGRWLVGAAALLLLLGAAAAVIYVQTDYGELEIQLSDPNADVTVKVNGQEVTLTADGRPVRIRAGKNQTLIVSGPGYMTEAQSFEVKRGEKTVARVTLRKVPPDPGVPPKKDTVPPWSPGTPTGPSIGAAAGAFATGFHETGAAAAAQKPPPFPDKPTLIEVPGYQILTDAPKGALDEWLAARKKAGHSVLHLDVVEVGGQPLYSAVAALDGRVPDWVAYPDIPGAEANDGLLLQKRFAADQIDGNTQILVSLSGFTGPDEFRAALLFHPGTRLGGIMGAVPLPVLARNLQKAKGLQMKYLRPFPLGEALLYAAYAETGVSKPAPYKYDLTGADLDSFEKAARTDGHRVHSLVAYKEGADLRFAVVCADNKDKWEWEVVKGLPAAELKTVAARYATKGFRPHSITACPHDGAVRYCVVWVREPVPYPKGPTLIKLDGYEILTDATKEQMDEWLKQRKAAKHSVIWLDGYAVEGKPLYSAVAALDDREPGWTALLDLPAIEFANPKKLSETVHTEKNRVISLSGFNNGPSLRCVALFHPGVSVWSAGPMIQPTFLPKIAEDAEKNGMRIGFLRAYPVRGGFNYAALAEAFEKGAEPVYAAEMKAADFDAYLAKQRAAGCRLANVSVAERDEQLWYTAVMVPDPKKAEWEVHQNLTAESLKVKAADMAKRGFVPTCLTGYGWDGKTRYIGVWVKEPPKPPPFPKAQTLVEVPGWQVLAGATKDEMRKWLDEKKKAKHSVLWLDAYPVDGKPLYSAVAALDDRQADWVAVVDVPAADILAGNRFGPGIDVRKLRVASFSGFEVNDKFHSAALFHPPAAGWQLGPHTPPEVLPNDLAEGLKFGARARLLRPFPFDGGCRYAVMKEVVVQQPPTHVYEATPEELAKFLKETRDKGYRPASLAACPNAGELRFAAVSVRDPKAEWDTDTGLTAAQLKAKADEQAKKGFRAACVTAYAWDGAVRYCVIWVKEAPKKEPDKKP